jgi:hypothetical protein
MILHTSSSPGAARCHGPRPVEASTDLDALNLLGVSQITGVLAYNEGLWPYSNLFLIEEREDVWIQSPARNALLLQRMR